MEKNHYKVKKSQHFKHVMTMKEKKCFKICYFLELDQMLEISSHDMKTRFLNSFSNRTWRYFWIYVDMCMLNKLSFAPTTFAMYF